MPAWLSRFKSGTVVREGVKPGLTASRSFQIVPKNSPQKNSSLAFCHLSRLTSLLRCRYISASSACLPSGIRSFSLSPLYCHCRSLQAFSKTPSYIVKIAIVRLPINNMDCFPIRPVVLAPFCVFQLGTNGHLPIQWTEFSQRTLGLQWRLEHFY